MQDHSPLEGESQKSSRQAKADAVGGTNRHLSLTTNHYPLITNQALTFRRWARTLPCPSSMVQ